MGNFRGKGPRDSREKGQVSVLLGTMLLTFLLFFTFVINTGMLEATGTGGLHIQSTAVSNVGGAISANGGNVTLQSAVIIGGTLETSNGGVFHAVNTSTLDGTNGNTILNAGLLEIDNNNSLVLQGAIDNAGTIALEGQNGWATLLQMNAGTTTLTGGVTFITDTLIAAGSASSFGSRSGSRRRESNSGSLADPLTAGLCSRINSSITAYPLSSGL